MILFVYECDVILYKWKETVDDSLFYGTFECVAVKVIALVRNRF